MSRNNGRFESTFKNRDIGASELTSNKTKTNTALVSISQEG